MAVSTIKNFSHHYEDKRNATTFTVPFSAFKTDYDANSYYPFLVLTNYAMFYVAKRGQTASVARLTGNDNLTATVSQDNASITLTFSSTAYGGITIMG